MSRARRRILWAALALLATLDAVSTGWAIDYGGTEGNPIVAALLGSLGPLALVVSQAVYLAAVWLVVALVDERGRETILRVGIGISSAVVVNNAISVAMLKPHPWVFWVCLAIAPVSLLVVSLQVGLSLLVRLVDRFPETGRAVEALLGVDLRSVDLAKKSG